jgi:hypothetical protein
MAFLFLLGPLDAYFRGLLISYSAPSDRSSLPWNPNTRRTLRPLDLLEHLPNSSRNLVLTHEGTVYVPLYSRTIPGSINYPAHLLVSRLGFLRSSGFDEGGGRGDERTCSSTSRLRRCRGGGGGRLSQQAE